MEGHVGSKGPLLLWQEDYFTSFSNNEMGIRLTGPGLSEI